MKRAIIAVQSILWVACLGKNGDTGGETHWQKGWLRGCISDAGCDDGFSCIEQLCTLACTTDEQCEAAGCGDCLDVNEARACALPERLGCIGGTTPCTADIEGWFCSVGAPDGCTTAIEICHAGQWTAGSIDSCRETITKTPQATSTAVYETDIGDNEVALDILFVIDNSSSMAAEQTTIVDAFDDFLTTLNAQVDGHPRIAVTTVDAQCANNGTSVFAAQGVFNQHAPMAWPPPAQFTIRTECVEDADCDAAACSEFGDCDGSEWACRTATSEACIVNPNGSINTTCRRRCLADEECQEVLGDERYICQKPSNNEADWGCLLPPPTQGCPDDLPPFVDSDQLDLARCLMVVGINQEKCLKFEQGLEATRLSLDPQGLNAAQVAAFMRPEAILVVIIVSDEDDCSASITLSEDTYETCSLLDSTDLGGPLVPTDDYVAFLKSLKPQGRVMTVAIVGQSTASSPAAQAADYDAYVASLSDPKDCFHQTTLCGWSSNLANWGRRYADVANGFGPDGHVENICGLNEDSTAQFANVANKIASNAKRICLPRADQAGLVASVDRGGVTTVLGADDYAIIADAPECSTGFALAPKPRLDAGDRVRFEYPE